MFYPGRVIRHDVGETEIYPFTKEEVNTSQKYTSGKPSHTMRRVSEAVFEGGPVTLRFKNHVKTGSVAGAIAGAVVGAVIGASIGLAAGGILAVPFGIKGATFGAIAGGLPSASGALFGLFGAPVVAASATAIGGGTFGGALGAGAVGGISGGAGATAGSVAQASAIGAGSGAAGGAAAGAAAGAAYSLITINVSGEYRKWRVEKIDEKVYPIWRTFLEENDLTEFECPLSGELIHVPVRALDGQVYELKAIEERIRRVEAEAALLPERERSQHLRQTSPLGTRVITVESLSFDPTFHERLFANLSGAYNQVVDEVLRNGIDAYQRTIVDERRQLIGELHARITGMTLTEQERQKYRSQVDRLMLVPTHIG